MARSIDDVQNELLNENFLERLGESKKDFDSFVVVESIISKIAVEFVLAVQENLNKMGKVSTGGLVDGVSSGKIKRKGSVLTVEIGYDLDDPASLYWDYVNQGVRGIVSKQPSKSKYRFRKLSVPPVMAEAIYGWIEKNNISAVNEDQKKGLSKLQKKRKKISKLGDPRMSLAYAISMNIKKRGLPYTGFWDKAVKEYLGSKFVKAVAKSAGADIRLQIRKFKPSGKR